MPAIKSRSVKPKTPRGVRIVRNREIIRVPRKKSARPITDEQRREAEPPAA